MIRKKLKEIIRKEKNMKIKKVIKKKDMEMMVKMMILMKKKLKKCLLQEKAH